MLQKRISFRFARSSPMPKAMSSPARDQALRDSLLVRFTAASAAGNSSMKMALSQEAAYLGIHLNKIAASTPALY